MPTTPTAHDDDGDLHDLGLLHDLGVLGIDLTVPSASAADELAVPSSRFGRRRALALISGSAGALALAACDRGGRRASATTSSTSSTSATSSTLATTSTTAASGPGSTTPTTAPTPTTQATSSSSVTSEVPDETGGPYPADGTNGPNALTTSGIVRSDITSSFGQYSGRVSGVPLTLALTIVHAGTGKAYSGAAMYLWHADPLGRYSLYSSGATDQNWLRGVQQADSNGRLSFRTVFPGAYDGRWPHLHLEVFSSLAGATSASGKVKTSQMAMPAATCDAVYATSGYGGSQSNLSRTSLARDMVFSDGYSLQLPTITGDTKGLTASLTVAV